MKKLIIILTFIFCWSISFSQVFTNPRSSSSITVQDSRLSIISNFYLPRLGDTTLAGGLDTIGNLIYDRGRAKLWIRDTILAGGHKWTQILKTGDVTATTWGSITGTLSSQTDLQNALNLKLNISDTSSMLSVYLRKIDTANKWVTSVFRKTASDSVFYVKGGNNIFAFKDSSGGAGSTNSNIGNGYRWAVPGTNNIKTAFGNNTITIDSSSNSNALTFKVDTSYIATQSDISVKLNISDTASMLNPYLRKIDTTAKWITNVYRKIASDSVFYVKGGTSVFAFIDSVGTGGGGGVTTLAPIGSSPNANGGTISGSTLNFQPASASFGGVVTTGIQDIAGAKAFIDKHNTIEGFSARLNSQWFPSEKVPDSIANGKYQAFGITDIFPSGTLVTVYSEGDNHVLNNGVIKMKKSHDNGRTWTTTTIVNNTPGVSIPGMGSGGVTQSGRLIVFYYRFFGSTFQSLNIIYSDDEGATFSSPVTVSPTPYTSNILPYGPLAKIGGDSLLLCFYGFNGDTSGVKIIKSGDDGVTWGSPITIVQDTINSYDETSVAYLGGNSMIAISRTEVNNGHYAQFLSTDNGNTWSFKGHVTWGTFGTPCWLRTYAGVNGRRVVVGYHRNGTLANFQIRAIYGYAQDLLIDSSGWDLNSEVVLADSVNGSGYVNIVHPYDNPYGIGWYYDEIVPQADATMKFLVVPKNTALPLKQSFASDVILSDQAGNGIGTAGIDNNGMLSFVADGSGNQWIRSGSNVYRTNQVGIGAAPSYDFHINKSSGNATEVIKSGTANGNVAALYLTEDNGLSSYGGILKYSAASSTTPGDMILYNFGNRITLSNQFSGSYVKNLVLATTGGIGIGGEPETSASLHVQKSAGSVNLDLTSGTGAGFGANFNLGEDPAFGAGTYAQFIRYTNATSANPGDFIINNLGKTIMLSTAYGSGFRKDLQVLSSGAVRFSNAYSFPTTDGTANQVLQTNGSGTLSFATIASGITTLNTLTATTQTFATGTSGTDFNISSATSTHTFNIPTASASNRGLLSTTDWSTFNGKVGSINSQTGSTQTIAGGTGISVNSGSNTHTISLDTNYVITGVFTPTLTNVSNVGASTAYQCQYMRVGNVVTVSGKVDIDPTAVGTWQLGMSLPIASGFTASEQCGGTGVAGAVSDLYSSVRADATNDRAEFIGTIPTAGSITNNTWYFTFTYSIPAL